MEIRVSEQTFNEYKIIKNNHYQKIAKIILPLIWIWMIAFAWSIYFFAESKDGVITIGFNEWQMMITSSLFLSVAECLHFRVRSSNLMIKNIENKDVDWKDTEWQVLYSSLRFNSIPDAISIFFIFGIAALMFILMPLNTELIYLGIVLLEILIVYILQKKYETIKNIFTKIIFA